MKKVSLLLCAGLFLLLPANLMAEDVPISEATSECIDCHATIHPGIVKDWQNSRHAQNVGFRGRALEDRRGFHRADLRRLPREPFGQCG